MRSSRSGTRLRSRGSIILYQTAESYRSSKHSACSMACCDRALQLRLALRVRRRRGRDSQRQQQQQGQETRMPARPVASPTPSLPRRNASASPAGNSSAASARRWRYSSLPASRPRSPTTTRCGMPMSSASANLTPGRSSRSSSSTSTPAAMQLVVEAFCGFTDTWRLRCVDGDDAPPGRARWRPAR